MKIGREVKMTTLDNTEWNSPPHNTDYKDQKIKSSKDNDNDADNDDESNNNDNLKLKQSALEIDLLRLPDFEIPKLTDYVGIAKGG